MSEFTTEGFSTFPNIYQDNQQTQVLSTWQRPVLDDRLHQYCDFVRRDDLMPRAKDQASRFLCHLIFELSYRDGFYDTREE